MKIELDMEYVCKLVEKSALMKVAFSKPACLPLQDMNGDVCGVVVCESDPCQDARE